MKWPSAVMLPPEPDALLDRFASLAARTLRAPMAVLSLLDETDRVVLPGAAGMPDPWQSERTMRWGESLCRFATDGTGGLVVVDDVADDPRAPQYAAAVEAFGVRSWIAAPLRFTHDFTRLFDDGPGARDAGTGEDAVLRDVQVVLDLPEIHDLDDLDDPGAPRDGRAPGEPTVVWGVLCVLDTAPRHWDERDRELVTDLAAAAAAELRSRVLTSRAVSAEQQMAVALAATRAVQNRSRLLLSLSRGLSRAETVQDVSDILTDLLRRQLGVDHFGLLLHEVEHHRARYVDMSTFPPGTDPAWESFDLRASTAPAARAVAEGTAFFCDDRDAVLATDPHLTSQGAWDFPGAVVILPLLSGTPGPHRQTSGALVLVWPAPRDTADQADRALWLSLADYTAQTLARVQYAARLRSSAETLQRSMLTRLPEPDSLEVRARYVPAASGERVGGDWYDAVVTPDGATTLVIGDVTGHDMAAAAGMGQVRGLLRAFAYDRDEAPAALVGRLDRAVTGLGVDTLATLVLARIEQTDADAEAGLRRLRWTNAGHPPPVLLLADGSTRVLDSTPELLIGLLERTGRSDHEAVVPPGSTLLLYTDGLIEHRGRSLTDGLEELERVLSAGHADGAVTLEDLLDHLVRELVGDDPDDDCAVLAVRAHPQGR
ncbi:PP2C family protein-serine/threonine phosphatase [Kineococcus sp. LSe6-4]|uniref:PP2C family protein-serine/threonine phosphatase n=1 Tax=Kineococcus halophytocola TaxID=3234027 RepID=A0ABV4GVK8_9ACTN